jgi:hypothetical protein
VGPEDHSSSEDDTAAYEYKLEELTVGDVLVFAGNDLVPWLCVVEKVTLSLARVAYLKKDGEKGVWVRDKGMGVISVLHDPEKNGKKGELGLGNILGIVDWVHKNDVNTDLELQALPNMMIDGADAVGTVGWREDR